MNSLSTCTGFTGVLFAFVIRTATGLISTAKEGRPFIIAHEIGHMLLKHTCNTLDSEDGIKETEANSFAAELLMPLEMIKRDCSKKFNLDDLARRYTVSKEAICYRLMDTKII